MMRKILAAVAAFAVAADVSDALAAGPDCANAGPKCRQQFEPRDFEVTRADGRFTDWVAWANDQVASTKPVYSLDGVKGADEFPAWRRNVQRKLRELLEIPDVLPKVEFKLLKEEPRKGFRLRTYEFYPEPKLAVKMMMTVPDRPADGKSRMPAVICLPGSGASLESLVGEPDDCMCHFPARNRQAWFFGQMGVVGVALENPATARNATPGIDQFACQMQYHGFMKMLGRSGWGMMTRHVLEMLEFLGTLDFVDPSRIGVSGMSLGCIPALYAAVADDRVACCIYNDYVSSWAANATSVRRRGRTRGSNVDIRRPVGFYRWFDDEPDLMAAVAPRPMIFTEGGAWKACIEKVKRGYALAGAPDALEVRYYEKYADPASRKYEQVDLHAAKDLTENDYLVHSNVDAAQHSFHPDVNLPWLAKVFFGGDAFFTPEFRRTIDESVKAPPAW